MLCCRHKPSHIQHLVSAFQEVNLDALQKKAITARLQTLLEEYSDRTGRYSRSFHSLRVIITVGSLIVPALLSVQYNVNTAATSIDEAVYWIVWMLSLLVTISNGIVTLFKVDKKYYVLNTTFQHIVSEGWQYIELSGKYSGHKTPTLIPTHQNQFIIFATSLEKIRMRNIEDEYYKITEQHTVQHTTAPGQQQPQQTDNLVPPSAAPPPSLLNSEQSVNGTTLRRRDPSQTPSLGRTTSTVFESSAQAPLLPVEESSARSGVDE
jgi:hypothetical protein